MITYILAIMGLTAFIGGGLTSLALLLIWGIFSRPAASTDHRQASKTARSDEISSEAGWSEVSSGAQQLPLISPSKPILSPLSHVLIYAMSPTDYPFCNVCVMEPWGM